MEELIKILNEVKPGVDYEHETDLIGHGIIDSVTMVTMVLEISDAFDIDITPVDIIPENFKNVNTIYDMITRLQDE
jgi:acyl carrier protein